MIETKAMRTGTRARKDAKTKVRTTSAPTPPTSASMRTAGPPLSSPESVASGAESGQVNGRTCDLETFERLARGLFGLGVLPVGRLGAGHGVDDREGRGAVVGDEGLVSGRGI